MTKDEIRELSKGKNTVELRPERDNKECKEDKKDKDDKRDKDDKKDKKECKRDKKDSEQGAVVQCKFGPDNPHLSRTSGFTAINVHLSVQCPVEVALTVIVGTLSRDLMESIGFAEGHFTSVRSGQKVMVPMPADCKGGRHLYTALQFTFIDAPGYVQVTDFVTGSTAWLDNC